METVELKAKVRENVGKKYSKKLRHENLIPGVVYKEGEKTVHLKLSEKDLVHALRTKAGENVLISLKVEDGPKAKGKERVVVVKEMQHHPIKEQILHVDFQEISLTEKLTIDVPIALKGEAEGVVKEEGVLEHIIWEVKVECLPTDIPEKIEVEVSAMKIGDKVLVKDLVVPPGVTILDDSEQAVIAVELPHVEKPKEEGEEEALEPELIREKKELEEGEEEEGAEEKKVEPKAEKKEATDRKS